VINYAGRYAAT